MPNVNTITDSILAIENKIINNIAFESVVVYQFI